MQLVSIIHYMHDAYELLWGSTDPFLHACIRAFGSLALTVLQQPPSMVMLHMYMICMGDPHMQVLKRVKENNILVGK